jgi:hypothetical protein
MGKRNLKKEKAERNKAYARQFRKTKTRFNSKFSKKNYNGSSNTNQDSNDDQQDQN